MNCKIIKDLLPSYIDEICSEESVNIIDEHLKTCEECLKLLEEMNQEVTSNLEQSNDLKAKNPFSVIKKKHIKNICIAIVLAYVIGFLAMFVYHEADVVNNFFSPTKWANVNLEAGDDGWHQVKFDGEEYLNFDSYRYDREIVNVAMNEYDVLIRVKDVNGNIFIDGIPIREGVSSGFKVLQKDTDYIVEMKPILGYIIEENPKECEMEFSFS